MTPGNRKFADLIISGMAKRKAAIAAGYSERSAHAQACRMLKDDEIAAYIADGQRKAAEKAQVDAQWVLRELADTYHHARELKQAGAATQALSLLGKHFGMFSDRLIIEDLRKQAAAVAEEHGLDPEEVQAEAERWLAGKR